MTSAPLGWFLTVVSLQKEEMSVSAIQMKTLSHKARLVRNQGSTVFVFILRNSFLNYCPFTNNTGLHLALTNLSGSVPLSNQRVSKVPSNLRILAAQPLYKNQREALDKGHCDTDFLKSKQLTKYLLVFQQISESSHPVVIKMIVFQCQRELCYQYPTFSSYQKSCVVRP